MKLKLARVIGLLVFTLMALLPGAMPVSASAMDHSVSQNCAPQSETTVPACCLVLVCPVSQSTAATDVPSPARPATLKTIYAVKLAPAQTGESPASYERLLRGAPPASPACSFIKLRCRNCPGSEEPPLV